MYSNVLISGVGVSYPENNVTTFEELDKYFKLKDIRIENLMRILGKNKRFSIDEHIDYFYMLEDASKKAVEEAKISLDDIDVLVVVADTPEYVVPTNAIKLGERLGLKNVKMVYDINANCAGSIVAIDQVSRYLKTSKHYKNALIATIFVGSYLRRDTDAISYGTFSDAASAIVLQKVEENIERGVIDSNYKSDCNYSNMDIFPAKGFGDMFVNNNRSNEDVMINISKDVDLSFIPDMWEKLIRELLKDNNLEPKDIDKYYFSQFSLFHIRSTLGKLKIPKEKNIYVGDKYGYTGCCSPIFALNYSMQIEKSKQNSYSIFCAVGSGYTSVALLYKN